jgi:hypothetical protein
MLPRALLLSLGLAALVGFSDSLAQDGPKKDPPKEKPAEKAVGFDPKLKKSSTPTKGLRKYDDVVTKEAKTTQGIFTVHRIEDKVLFEIPQERLGKLMMLRAEVSKAPAGSGGMMSYNGRVLRTEFTRYEVHPLRTARKQDPGLPGSVLQTRRRQIESRRCRSGQQ